MGWNKQYPPKKLQTRAPALPAGVELVRSFHGHWDRIGRIAWSPDGRYLASPSKDKTVRMWDAETGQRRWLVEGHEEGVTAVAFDHTGGKLASASADQTVKIWDTASGQRRLTLRAHSGPVWSVAFAPTGRMLATAGEDRRVKIWDAASGHRLRYLEGLPEIVTCVVFDPAGRTLASARVDHTVQLWDADSGRPLRSLEGHSDRVLCVTFDPAGRTLASTSEDRTIKLWDARSGQLLRSLEGHTDAVRSVAFSPDARLIASQGNDDTIRLWRGDTGACVASISEEVGCWLLTGLAYHPHQPLLATVGTDPERPERGSIIKLWKLDVDLLLGLTAASGVAYTSAKIVLVGESGVGKTGLGWRLAHGDFRKHESTHGQQFWVLDQLSTRRRDGTQCEAVLWDLAGQPDYRLVNALFLDDADLALVLFDPTDRRDPLHGVDFWLKQLETGASVSVGSAETPPQQITDGTPAMLVAARCDRGSSTLTLEELETYCHQRGIRGGCLHTSAKTGEGIGSAGVSRASSAGLRRPIACSSSAHRSIATNTRTSSPRPVAWWLLK